MKKTFLISIVSLFSVALFAQTTVNSKSDVKSKSTVQTSKNGSEVNHSESASTALSIQSNDLKNAENKSKEKIKKGKKATDSKKQKTSEELKATRENIENPSSNSDIHASGQSNSSVTLSKSDNNLNEKTSVKGKGAISTESILNNEKQVNNEGKVLIKTKTTEIAEASAKSNARLNKKMARAERKINKTGSASLNAAGSTSNSVQIKPVSVKSGTNIKTKAGIKIK
jgi:hypothetical protein